MGNQNNLNISPITITVLYSLSVPNQILDIQNPQKDRVSHGADGGSEGSVQDLPVVPVDVLAPGVQGAHLHQRSRGADEHGGEVETKDGLRPGGGGQSGRDWKVRGVLRC